MPGYDTIRIDTDDGDARIRLWTLDRPDSRNAIRRRALAATIPA